MNVSACLVTRGDVDLREPLDAIRNAGITDTVVWDNSAEDIDVVVYGRYRAIDRAYYDVIYTQDDDCVIEPHALKTLLAGYQPGQITANMPMSRWGDYPDSCLVGWGSVFDRHLPDAAFTRFMDHYDGDIDLDDFHRDCDVVFTTLTPHQKLDLGFRHLPWAELDYRMFRQARHQPKRAETLAAAREVRDW